MLVDKWDMSVEKWDTDVGGGCGKGGMRGRRGPGQAFSQRAASVAQ